MNGTIAIGKVSTTHGVHGDIRIVSLSGETEHFLSLESLCLERGGVRRVYDLEYIKVHQGALLAKFVGIDSPEAAKKLTGSVVVTERQNACPIQEGEFYQADILGCDLYYDGKAVGKVVATVESGPKELLEVMTPEGPKLIPFEDAFIGEVKTAEKMIELKQDWLL